MPVLTVFQVTDRRSRTREALTNVIFDENADVTVSLKLSWSWLPGH